MIKRDRLFIALIASIALITTLIKHLVARVLKLAWVIVALVIIVSFLTWLGYSQGWKTGFDAYTDPVVGYHPAKTLWDWMELLIVPIVLAIGGLLFSQSERRAERRNTDDRNREITLQNYLDKMTELLLKERLADPEASSTVCDIARARTVTTLRQLDVSRRSLLLGFLRQADLINKDDPVRILAEADLGGANLSRADLGEADLSGADLSRADLSGADLSGADLSKAHLGKANLSEAHLGKANLNGAYLVGADLSGANLNWANLNGTCLSGANLSRASLGEADLSGASLNEANLSRAFLLGAHLNGTGLNGANLSRANLNGTRYDDTTQWPKGFTPPPTAIRDSGALDEAIRAAVEQVRERKR